MRLIRKIQENLILPVYFTLSLLGKSCQKSTQPSQPPFICPMCRVILECLIDQEAGGNECSFLLCMGDFGGGEEFFVSSHKSQWDASVERPLLCPHCTMNFFLDSPPLDSRTKTNGSYFCIFLFSLQLILDRFSFQNGLLKQMIF